MELNLNEYLSPKFQVKEIFNLKKSYPVTKHDIAKARMLCRLVLQPLRDYIGSAIIITSGKRNKKHNKKVGGVRTSDHLYREGSVAVDFTNQDIVKCFEYIMNIHMDIVGQLIIYPDRNFIHVSLSTPKHTGQILVKRSSYEKYTGPEQLI